MSDVNAFVIEIDDDAAGLAVQEGSGYAFHALAPGFAHLEGRRFRSPAAAERACRQASQPRSLAAGRERRPPRRISA